MLRPCLRCGVLTDDSYCREHRPRRPRGRELARLRAQVFAVYGRKCADCGRSDGPLEVHHVNGDTIDNRLANLIRCAAIATDRRRCTADIGPDGSRVRLDSEREEQHVRTRS